MLIENHELSRIQKVSVASLLSYFIITSSLHFLLSWVTRYNCQKLSFFWLTVHNLTVCSAHVNISTSRRLALLTLSFIRPYFSPQVCIRSGFRTFPPSFVIGWQYYLLPYNEFPNNDFKLLTISWSDFILKNVNLSDNNYYSVIRTPPSSNLSCIIRAQSPLTSSN